MFLCTLGNSIITMIDIINSLNSNDKKLFESTIAVQSDKVDSPILQLFKAHKNNKIDLFKKNCKPNSYYVYQKRLKQKLIKFVADKTINEESTEEISPLKHLIASRKLLLLGIYPEGYKALAIAKKEAKAINHFSLLNEIYQTEIQYLENTNEKQIYSLHKSLLDNNQQFLKQEKLNLAYSLVKNSLKKDSEENNKHKIDTIFSEAIREFNLDSESVLNFKQIYQLVEVINLKAIQDKNFESTSLFFINQLNKITNSALDNIDSAPYHIKTLLALANIQFRKKDFHKSLLVLDQVNFQIEKYKTLNPALKAEYILLYAMNLNFTGSHLEASNIIDHFLSIASKDSSNNFNIRLVRCMIHFQQNEQKEALKLLSSMNESDGWIKKNIGFEWLLNKKYLEVLLHIELGNFELVDSRINSLLKSHKAYFVKNETFQIIPFLKLIKQYIKSPLILKSTDFPKLLNNTIINKPNNSEDLFFMCFYAWLKSKIEEKPLYELTLGLLTN